MSAGFHGPPPSWPRLVLAVAMPRAAIVRISRIADRAAGETASRPAGNSPVHLSAAGSQTSIFTSVSPGRVASAVTRQKAGRSAKRAALGGAGGTNAPAATGSAAVIRAPVSATERSRSHAAASGLWARATVEYTTSTAPVRKTPTRRVLFMGRRRSLSCPFRERVNPPIDFRPDLFKLGGLCQGPSCCVRLGVALAAGSLGAQAPSRAVPPAAVLDKYCVTCHNERLKTAGLMLDAADVNHVGDTPETWEKVARKLRTGEMPPPGRPRPDDATYARSRPRSRPRSMRAAAATPESRPRAGPSPEPHRVRERDPRSARARGRRARAAACRRGRSAGLRQHRQRAVGVAGAARTLPVGGAHDQPPGRRRSRDAARSSTRSRFPRRWCRTIALSDDLPFGSRGGTAIRYHFPLDGEYTHQGPAAAAAVSATSSAWASRTSSTSVSTACCSKRFTDRRRGRRGMTAPGELRRQHAGRSASGKSTCTPPTRTSRSACR